MILLNITNYFISDYAVLWSLNFKIQNKVKGYY